MQSALEKSFAAIVEKHDLTLLEVSYHRPQSGYRSWRANVHWDGYTNTGHQCTSEHGDTIAEALAAVLESAKQDRMPTGDVLADEALPEIVV